MRPYYIDHRPLGWRSQQNGIHRDAILRVLQSVQTLETHDSARDTTEAPSAELQAIHNRLDLLVTMVSQLCAHQMGAQRPQAQPLLFHSDGILWPAGTLEAGRGQLELYLHDVLPEPLRLDAQLTIIPDEEAGQSDVAELAEVFREAYPHVGALAAVSWDIDDPEVRDAITRQVFRHHRRSLARRQSTNTAPPSS
nr:PilZ domain-containing protein [Oceanococcus sp. HetDA_MAG_MS8]